MKLGLLGLIMLMFVASTLMGNAYIGGLGGMLLLVVLYLQRAIRKQPPIFLF
ncbi:MAG: hypothetical protein ACJAVV_000112 [Alphaproteobacteria bacterium]|jgi:hypothetical protein